MFNFFKKKKNTDTAEGVVSAVMNAVTSALSGKDLFNFILREKKYSTINRGLSLSAVFCALSMYSSSISTLPRNVMSLDSRTGEAIRKVTAVEGVHPAIRIFLQYANRELSSDDLMSLISNDILVDGNFYALREFDSQGRTLNIHYIHPSRIPKGNIYYTTSVEVDSAGDNIPIGTMAYRIESGQFSNSTNHKSYVVRRSQIVHLKGPILDPEYNRGVGVIENATRSFTFAENTEEYGNKFYQKGTNSQTFLSTKEVLGPEIVKRLESFFENNPDAPLETAFKTRILDRGLSPVNVAIPLGQLQFVETKAFSVEDIARWFSIPPELLHSRMGSGKSSADMADLVNNFVQWGVGPFITRIANQLRDELLPIVSRPNYSFEFERIYLYRTVINEFSQAIRNLFEIGVLDRMQIGKLIGIHINPKDKQNRQLYVPTNLMTVQHGMALEAKAETANNLLLEQIRSTKLANDNFVAPSNDPVNGDTTDTQDNSPDQQNEDKKIRTAKTALNAVLDGLHNHWEKVSTEKNTKGSDVTQWETDKFYPLIENTLSDWNQIINELTPYSTVTDLIDDWKNNTYTSVKGKCNEISV